MSEVHDWARHYPAAVTVCDAEGIIISMNEKAEAVFAAEGGASLVGSNLFDCHNPRSQEILHDMIEHRKVNCYTIQKNGKKKLIYQAPWYDKDHFGGFVELSIELPENMEHRNRDE